MKISNLFFSIILTSISFQSYSQVTKDEDPPHPDSIIWSKVDVEANFPGGDRAWNDFLAKNLNGMVPVEHSAPMGRYTVLVQFIVGLDGHINELKPLTHWGYGMEEEVLRVLNKTGQWSPALLDGKPVKAYRKQSVTFVVEDNVIDVKLLGNRDALYTGIDNFAEVSAKGVKQKNLGIAISEGSVGVSKGLFNLHVTTPGRAIITIFDKDKEIGKYSVEVKALDTTTRTGDEENYVWTKTETQAAFPGGDKAWIQFIIQNLNGLVPVNNHAPPGKYTVWIQFIVDKEGNVTDLKPLTNNGYGMEQEAMRVLKLVPKWVPAIQNGRNVRAYRKQPITFVVESQ